MAIPVARVHLAMAHAALPGLLPTPPKRMMLPLLPAPPCAAAVILHPSSPPRPISRADAAARWDAHKTKHGGGGGGGAASPSSAGRCSLDSKSGRPGRASSCDSWVSSKKMTAGGAATSTSSSSSSGGGSGRADSDERWDARKKKKPASPAASSASSSATASWMKRRDGSKRPSSRASSSSSDERWDASKNGGRPVSRADELDDGEGSTGSNDDDVESGKATQPPPPLQRGFYAGPGFITSPEPSMLPMPTFMIRVK